MTNFELILTHNYRCKDFCVKLKCNEKYVIRLNEVYSKYALLENYKIVKKPRNGTVELNSKSKLVYTPDKDYIGKDKFSLLCDNVIPELSIVIDFHIKIGK